MTGNGGGGGGGREKHGEVEMGDMTGVARKDSCSGSTFCIESYLNLISIPPGFTTVSAQRSQSFCPKCRCQITPSVLNLI